MARKTGGRKKQGSRSSFDGRRFLGKSFVVRWNQIPTRFAGTDWLVAAALALAIFVVYGQVINHQFISLDDDVYIRDNQMVNAGVTLSGLTWAFTTFHAANWHPVTWIIHMVDSQLF